MLAFQRASSSADLRILLLERIQQRVAHFAIDVTDFNRRYVIVAAIVIDADLIFLVSFQDGRAFCALIRSFRSSLTLGGALKECITSVILLMKRSIARSIQYHKEQRTKEFVAFIYCVMLKLLTNISVLLASDASLASYRLSSHGAELWSAPAAQTRRDGRKRNIRGRCDRVSCSLSLSLLLLSLSVSFSISLSLFCSLFSLRPSLCFLSPLGTNVSSPLFLQVFVPDVGESLSQFRAQPFCRTQGYLSAL